MQEVLCEYIPDKEEDIGQAINNTVPVYVLSNKNRLFGASCILYPELIQDFAQAVGSDLYIIPSCGTSLSNSWFFSVLINLNTILFLTISKFRNWRTSTVLFINFTTIVKNEIEKRAGKNYHVRLKDVRIPDIFTLEQPMFP